MVAGASFGGFELELFNKDFGVECLVTLVWVGVVAAGLLILFPLGYLGYDGTYALIWGRELARGVSPDYGAVLASTPHPLFDLFGFLVSGLSPLAALDVAMVISYAALGLLANLVYRLGRLWFDRGSGLVAAAIIVVSPIVLGASLRGALDIPYVAICIGALLVESHRRRAGWPVLALLAFAGLLRPEAWLFSGAYWLYLVFEFGWSRGEAAAGRRSPGRPRIGWRGERSPLELVLLAVLTAAAPVIWGAFDLITSGNPVYSFTSTKETVKTLGRQRGPVEFVLHGPHRIGQVIEWPAATAAIVGIVFGLICMPRRVALGLVAAVLAVVAFGIVGSGGLAIISRYAILSGSLLAIFAGLGLLGWRLLPAADRRRRWWGWAAIALALFFVAWIPRQWNLDDETGEQLGRQSPIERGLSDAVSDVHRDRACGPVGVPGYPALPRTALGFGLEPSSVLDGRVPAHGYLIVPASSSVVSIYLPDESGLRRSLAVPPGFALAARNTQWRIYDRC